MIIPNMKNPPAYPAKTYFTGHFTGTRREGDETPGMSLLDHFAGLAMQGMVAHDNPKELYYRTIAAYAYLIARAMLEERAKPENQL